MNDRNVTIYDEKQRVLDLTSYNFAPPQVGIYDEPVRYYKANLEWAKILEGHIEWLAEVAAWKEANEEDYFAIQQVLIFLEGTECGMSDLTEILDRLEALEMALSQMCEDVKCGVITGFEELASRILLAANKDNVLSDIAIGKEDGAITIANPPAQPPGVVEASNFELANGLTYAVGVGVREYFETINSFQLGGISSNDAAGILLAIYDVENVSQVEMQGFLETYWNRWVVFSPTYIPNAGKVSEFVWLYGASKKTLLRYALYVQSDIDLVLGKAVFSLLSVLADSQVAEWYQQGQGQPRLDYLLYPDYRNPASNIVELDIDMIRANAGILDNLFDAGQIKAPTNRWLLKHWGAITLTSTGQTYDGFYIKNTNGSYSIREALLRFSGNVNLPPEQQPPRSETHTYQAYYSQTVANIRPNAMRYQGGVPAWTNAQTTGTLKLQVFDLGKV